MVINTVISNALMQPETIEMTPMSVQDTSKPASPNTPNDEEHSSLPRRTIESIDSLEMKTMSVQDIFIIFDKVR